MTLDSSHWKTVESIFADALDQPASVRVRYVNERVRDPAVRAEILLLLASSSGAGQYLATLANRAGLPAVPDLLPDRMAGRTIGRYRLERLIGRGGMGMVYLAARADGEYEQQVALKLLPIGIASDESRRRFLHERQILARLEHPNIARLIDGGVTEDGTPYFVMELVDGRPINRYADELELDVTSRIRLFIQACRALKHAHQHLIVHRDLKPANILVTPSGTVKLLDFGIAKVLHEQADDEVTLTAGGKLPMTLSYASPEQIRGEPVTTASDVYAMGVVLYQLLAGRRPHRFEGLDPAQVERTVATRVPLVPSRAVHRVDATVEADDATAVARRRGVSPDALARRLTGDLDAIVMTALRKEPERRYQSVGQLEEDLERHLSGRPVSARAESVAYVASRFVRRYRSAVAGAALVVVLLAALAVLLVRYAVTTAEQSRAVAAERDRAEQVSVFVQRLLLSLAPGESEADLESSRAILDESARRVDRELTDQPGTQARLLQLIGDLYGRFGLLDDARPVLERSLRVRTELFGDAHPAVAQTLASLGRWHWMRGEYDASERDYRRAIAIVDSALGPDDVVIADVLSDLGVLMQDRGDPEAAEHAYRRALDIRRRQLGADDPVTVRTLVNLGAALRDQGRLDEAQPLLETALESTVRAYGPNHPHVAVNLHNLGFVHDRAGRRTEAHALHSQALAIRLRSLGSDHRTTANSYHNLATTLRGMRRFADAEAAYRSALAIRRGQLRDGHPQTALSILGLGTTLFYHRRPHEAEPLLREGLAMREALFDGDHPQVVDTRVTLAGVLTALGRLDEAERLLIPSYRALVTSVGPDDPRTRAARRRVERLFQAQGRGEDAATFLAGIR